MARDYAAVPYEYLDEMDCLSDAEFGRLIRALLEYSKSGEAEELQGRESILWKRVRNREDRYKENFERKANANRENGNRGGRPTKPKKTERNPMKPNKTQKTHTDTDTDTNTNTETNISYGDTPPTPQGDAFAVFAAADTDLLDALRDFEAMRKKIKKPLTDKAKTLLLKKFDGREREEIITALQDATLHCWQSVYFHDDRRKEAHHDDDGDKTDSGTYF